MGVKAGKVSRRGILLSFMIIIVLLLPPFINVPTGNLVEAATMDWGSMKEVTDPLDYHKNNVGNLIGYLDQKATTAVFNGRMYVAWETSERNNVGTMIYVRSMKDDDWGPISAVAGVEDGVIDNEPAMAVFNGNLYLAWQHSGGDDTDIMCKELSGDTWSDCGYVSPQYNYGIDSLPSLIAYKGYLYAVWSTRSTTTGKDPNGDVVIRHYDGVEWSDNITIVNRFPVNGYDDQAKLAVYNDNLVVTWVTRDDKIKSGNNIDIVLREFDGENWGLFHAVSPPGGPNDDCSYPSVAVYSGKLYIAWQAPGTAPQFTNIDVTSWDGHQIDDHQSVTPKSHANNEHPSAKVFREALYVAWNSNDLNFTQGSNDNIAIAYFNGNEWSAPEQVSPFSMVGEYATVNRFPLLESYHGGLYAIWEYDDQRPSAKVLDAADLMYRRYPPESSKIDLLTVSLIVIIVILVTIFIVAWTIGTKRTKREKKYLDRMRRKELRKEPDAFIVRKRGGRKGKRRKKKFS